MLSICLLTTFSCDQLQKESVKKQDTSSLKKEDLISTLYECIQKNWTFSNIKKIDSLGGRIAKQNPVLTFHPYKNNYEKNTFIFSAESRKNFKYLFIDNFLTKTSTYSGKKYTVWRIKSNGRLNVDISIEPNPVLKWVLVIRKRN